MVNTATFAVQSDEYLNLDFALDNGIRQKICLNLRHKKVRQYLQVLTHFFLTYLKSSLSSRFFIPNAKSGLKETVEKTKKKKYKDPIYIKVSPFMCLPGLNI